HDRQRARNDREAGHDDFIAGLQVEQRHRQLQRNRAIGDGDAMLAAAIGRPLPLELLNVRPRAGDPASSQRLGDELDLAFAQPRLIDGDNFGRGPGAQKRSFPAPPGYGPCLISSSTRSSRTLKPCPPPTAISMSPTPISRVVTSSRPSVYTSTAHRPRRTI